MEILFSQPHPGCQWSRQDGSDGLSKIQTWDGSDWEDIRASNIVEHVVLSEIESGKKNALQLYCDINTRYCEIEKYLMSAELKGYDSVFVAGIDAE